MSVLPLEKDMFVAPVGGVFLFSCSQNCLHFCTHILRWRTNRTHMWTHMWLKIPRLCRPHKISPIAMSSMSAPAQFSCSHSTPLRSHLLPRSLHQEQPLRSRCRSINTALLRQMRSLALWLNTSSPTGYEPNVIDNFDFSETTEIFLQEQFSCTMPSYLHDAELSDETTGYALSSPLFTQEREESAGRRQAYHSFEES